jgi:hypothetical protein
LIDPALIREQLARICLSRHFRTSGRLRDFLYFIVVETIEGRGSLIKEYTIGTLVYARRSLFDPKIDSIVRGEALKLRARLTEYYAHDGSTDELVICVPKGCYVPEFHNRTRSVDSGQRSSHEIAELCDVGYLALMRRTPTSIAVATGCYAQARALNPTDLRPHLGLATGVTASLDIETAAPCNVVSELKAAVSRSLRINEDSGEAHVLASLWRATVEGIGGSAPEELARAIHLDSDSPVAHFWASGLLSAQGAHEESIEHFKRAIRRVPDCGLIRAYLGRALYYAGRYKQALDVLQDEICMDSALAVGHLWAALVRSELGQHDEAIQVAAIGARLSETSATLGTCAYVLARGERHEEAEAILERLRSSPPYDYVSPLQLAVIADALGQRKEAVLHLNNANRENAWALLWQEVDPRVKRIRTNP